MRHGYRPVGNTPLVNTLAATAAAPQRGKVPGPLADAVRPAGRGKLGALTVTTMALVILSYGRAHELFPATATLPVGKVMLPLGLGLLASRSDFGIRMRSLKTTPGRFLGLFLVSILASVPFSLWVGGSINEVKDLVLSGLPYLVILIGTAKTEEELDWLLRAVVISIIIFGGVIVAGGGAVTEGRFAASGTYDSNDIAMIAAVSMPFALRLMTGDSHPWKAVGVAGLAAALLLVLQTGSRGGMLAVAAIVVTYLFLLRKSIPGRIKVLLIGGLCVALAAAPGVFFQRLSTLGTVSADYNMTDPVGRVEIWKRGIGYFLERPLTGVGIGQFNAAEGLSGRTLVARGQGFKWSTAHNSFVLAAAELGLPGLVGFLGMLLPIFPLVRRLRRAASAERSLAPLAAQGEAIAIATIGFMVAGFFLSATYGPAAFTLVAFGISYAGLVRRTVPAAAFGRSPSARRSRAGTTSGRATFGR